MSSTAAGSLLETAYSKAAKKGEPVSALNYYEKAVEKEAAGSLGDSLRLYRKAFSVTAGGGRKSNDNIFRLSYSLGSIPSGMGRLYY